MQERTELRNIKNYIIPLIFAVTLAGCDMLEPDGSPAGSDAELSETPFYLSPGAPAIIDLRTMLNAAGNVRLSVSSQPRLGTLESLGNDLLRYTPNAEVANGRDGFGVSVFDQRNQFVKMDSVIIIITPDSTSYPCGVWAHADYVAYPDGAGGPIDIDVLANDTACAVSVAQLLVSITEIEVNGAPVPPAQFGTVEILANGLIRYTPGTEFTTHDQFVYTITKPANVPNIGDPEIESHGFVYISRPPVCGDTIIVNNDFYTFSLDSMTNIDSLWLDVIANDVYCNATDSVQLVITQEPLGHVWHTDGPALLYMKPDSVEAGFIDTFRYRLCVDTNCGGEAVVSIEFE